MLAVVGVVALSSGPAAAGHPPSVYPYVRFGFGYPFYHPYYSPWYGPQFGVGIQIGPRHTPSTPKDNSGGQQQALKLYVYPAAGQSDARTAEDRYQCHVWAAGQSGHDPTLGAGTRDEAESYTRALTACMEGRGYVVK
ncbi:MAG TPA: hypothetical protein VIQ99_03375 [Gammaproteobacteria bacterium]